MYAAANEDGVPGAVMGTAVGVCAKDVAFGII